MMQPPFSFFDVFPDLPSVEVVDVGAMPIDGLDEIYKPLMSAKRALLTAFEPDATAFAALKKALGVPHRCFPYFIGDGKPATFHVNAAPMTSSLYPPNDAVLALYPDVAPFVQVQSRHPVQTKRLDDIEELERIDFLKLDVQGAELDVLNGGVGKLAQTLVVHTEVEFVPLYLGQPLFGDIDVFLRAQGFQFHTFTGLAKRFVAPLKSPPGQPGGINQTLWADAVYMRDPLTLTQLPPERRLMLASLMHELYASVDVALYIVKSLAEAGEAVDYSGYVQRLQRDGGA
jgi:FkbM family methyltransferase